jgi:hypothetical protein
LEEAQECSKRYYDKTAKERTFFQGDKVMVYFPNAPPRINPKFFSHWVPYTEGMQQRDRRVSHAKEDEGKQHEEVRVSRGPAGAAAAVLEQDRDMRDQVEAEQGKKLQVKPKK